MYRAFTSVSFLLFFLLPGVVMEVSHVANAQDPDAPRPAEVPQELVMHGHKRIDEFYWLRERENPDVTSYLNQENEYTREKLADVAELQEKLFEETVARIKQDDQSVPYDWRGYRYYTRYGEGQQYPVYCRQKLGDDAPEEVMLDVNQLAEGQPFCSVAGVTVSTNNRLLAYAVDFQGRRKYTACFKDLETGEILPDRIENITGSLQWADDNKTVFYLKKDPQTLRSYLVRRHKLGTPVDQDVDVYEETDEQFNCSLTRSRSRDYIMVVSRQTLSTEYRLLPADQPEGEFQVFYPRRPDHEYSLDHLDGRFYIRSNDEASNFRLFSCSEQKIQRDAWQEEIPHRDDVFLADVDLLRGYVVVTERKNALTHLRILARDGSRDDYLPFEEAAYVVRATPTPDPDTAWLRYSYTSLTTPNSVYEINLDSGERKLLKQEEVLGGFQPDDYRTERLWATARDGTKVPVTVVYHKDTPIDGTAPCLEYGYGSYGASSDPRFRSTALNLLDRGFVYAIAHIRGGQELGRKWYEDGKLYNKINTFTDFIDVGKFLIDEGYANPQHLYARGGSAGGLLMGAVINLAPDLYHGVVADVPFVDVVTTMLDDSIPLTTFEYDEWGNPNEKGYYDYMLSYSPYDNLLPVEYPNLLVTTGLHDSQVQYWEPAKWVARLRKTRKGDNLLLLKTNMDAGHGGASGRFDQYKDVALRHAFLLKLAGIKE
jgi:oligopeptidase B